MFTLGNPDIYDPLLDEGNLLKAGRIPEEDFEGGCAFKTVQDAQDFRDSHPAYHGYAVYELAENAEIEWEDPDCGILVVSCRIINKIDET